MITCNLKGQLGNQMFIIAATVGLAKKHDVPYRIPNWIVDPNCKEPYFKDISPISKAALDARDNLPIYKEPYFHYCEIPYSGGNLCIDGYFQSQKYYSHCKEYIYNLFDIPYSLLKGIVGLHIRRGDYLNLPDYHPAIGIEYITKSIEYFITKGYSSFMVFSNGMDWCRENINNEIFKGCTFVYSNGNALDDLSNMSSCEHLMMSNSTFSWWAAELNRNPEKMIIAPKKGTWHGPKYSHLDPKDLYMDNWITL